MHTGGQQEFADVSRAGCDAEGMFALLARCYISRVKFTTAYIVVDTLFSKLHGIHTYAILHQLANQIKK